MPGARWRGLNFDDGAGDGEHPGCGVDVADAEFGECRSFFNHFSDKREIFFAGAAAFEEDVVQHLNEADPVMSPLGAAVAAMTAAGRELGEYRAFAPTVRALIGSSA